MVVGRSHGWGLLAVPRGVLMDGEMDICHTALTVLSAALLGVIAMLVKLSMDVAGVRMRVRSLRRRRRSPSDQRRFDFESDTGDP